MWEEDLNKEKGKILKKLWRERSTSNTKEEGSGERGRGKTGGKYLAQGKE